MAKDQTSGREREECLLTMYNTVRSNRSTQSGSGYVGYVPRALYRRPRRDNGCQSGRVDRRCGFVALLGDLVKDSAVCGLKKQLHYPFSHLEGLVEAVHP